MRAHRLLVLVSRGVKYRRSLRPVQDVGLRYSDMSDRVASERGAQFAPAGCRPAQISGSITTEPERANRCSRFIANGTNSRVLFRGRLPWRLIPFHSPAALLERVIGFGISRWRRESKNHCDDGKRTRVRTQSAPGRLFWAAQMGATARDRQNGKDGRVPRSVIPGVQANVAPRNNQTGPEEKERGVPKGSGVAVSVLKRKSAS